MTLFSPSNRFIGTYILISTLYGCERTNSEKIEFIQSDLKGAFQFEEVVFDVNYTATFATSDGSKADFEFQTKAEIENYLKWTKAEGNNPKILTEGTIHHEIGTIRYSVWPMINSNGFKQLGNPGDVIPLQVADYTEFDDNGTNTFGVAFLIVDNADPSQGTIMTTTVIYPEDADNSLKLKKGETRTRHPSKRESCLQLNCEYSVKISTDKEAANDLVILRKNYRLEMNREDASDESSFINYLEIPAEDIDVYYRIINGIGE